MPTLTFGASIRPYLGLGIVLSPVVALGFYVWLTRGHLDVFLISLAPPVALFAYLARLRVQLDNHILAYRGAFRTTRVPLADIVRFDRTTPAKTGLNPPFGFAVYVAGSTRPALLFNAAPFKASDLQELSRWLQTAILANRST